MRTVGAVALGVVVCLLGTVALMLIGAFIFRTTLGPARYRDLGLPALVITVAVVGGIALGFLSFRQGRARD